MIWKYEQSVASEDSYNYVRIISKMHHVRVFSLYTKQMEKNKFISLFKYSEEFIFLYFAILKIISIAYNISDPNI